MWSVRQWSHRPSDDPIAKQIRDATTAHDLIVLAGCPYPDPQWLYWADRRGLIFPGTAEGWPPHSAQSEGIWSRENINDYGFLFACDTKALETEGKITPAAAVDAAQYLPAGRSLVPTSVPGLWRIVPTLAANSADCCPPA